jgi:hypothetical protein
MRRVDDVRSRAAPRKGLGRLATPALLLGCPAECLRRNVVEE